MADETHAGYDEAVFRMPVGQLHHQREVFLQLLPAAAGQQGDYRTVAAEGGFEEADGVEQGVPYIEGLLQVIIGEEALLEGQDVAEAVEAFLHAFDAPFLPGPEVGGDIVNGLEALLVGPGLDFEVEARVVDAHHHVGSVGEDVLLAEADVAQHGAQVGHHLDEAHDGEVADVAYGNSSDSGHEVAAPEAELRIGVLLTQRPHEVGTVEIARGFAGYEVVFHWVGVKFTVCSLLLGGVKEVIEVIVRYAH